MNIGFIYLRRLLKNIDSTVTDIQNNPPSAGNPTGGTVNVATTNYLATLFQQWVSMTVGSASAIRMNLLSSLIEPFRLYASTNFYAKYSAITNALYDSISVLFAATGTYLDGYISPAHLRLACHFEGTNGVAIPSSIVAADSPVWNSSLGVVAKLNVNSNVVSNSGISSFSGGTPTASTGTAANFFDGDVSTLGARPTDSNPFWFKYDFGASPVALAYFRVYAQSSDSTKTFTVAGSNNDSDWTTIGSILITNGTGWRILSSANTTVYRYYRCYIGSNPSQSIYYYEFQGFVSDPSVQYSTAVHPIGNSSAYFSGVSYLSGTASAVNHLQLGTLDWHYRGFINFSVAPNPMTLFTILGKQIEIQATSTGLRVKYSTDGANFSNADSSAISWETGVNYFISIRRTGNTLYFYVDNVAKGTVDLTGVTFYATGTNSFYLGINSITTEAFKGYMDEIEFWVGESITDAVPEAARSTAYVPNISWESASQFIDSGATSLEVVFFLDEVKFASFGVPIVNTDLILSISINNGVNYYPVTLTNRGQLTVNTAIYHGTLSLTGKTNTNQLKYKIVGINNKPVKFDGLFLFWL